MSNQKLAEYLNTLQVSFRPKGIASGAPAITRADGGTNYGFKDLRGHPELIDTVPELQRDAELRALIVAVNAPETALFSIGCLSAPVEKEQGFGTTGYIEFALNSRSAITDAANYFPVFFHFAQMLHREGFCERVLFGWELSPVHFGDVRCDGFSATITVNTDHYSTSAEASVCWKKSLAALQRFLPAVIVSGNDPVYAPAPVAG